MLQILPALLFLLMQSAPMERVSALFGVSPVGVSVKQANLVRLCRTLAPKPTGEEPTPHQMRPAAVAATVEGAPYKDFSGDRTHGRDGPSA